MPSESVKIILKADDKASKPIKSVSKSLGGLAKTAGPLVAGFVGVGAAIKVLKSGIANYAEQQKANEGLKTSIELLGESVDKEFPKFEKWSSELQRQAGIADNVALELATYAQQLGFSADKSREMTNAAVGLAKVTGTDAKEALKKLSEATYGEVDAMAELIPAIRGATTEGEKWALVQEAAAKGLKLAKAETETLGGGIEQLKMAWGDFTEEIGAMIAPALSSITDSLTWFIQKWEIGWDLAVLAMSNAINEISGLADAGSTLFTSILSGEGVAGVILDVAGSAGKTSAIRKEFEKERNELMAELLLPVEKELATDVSTPSKRLSIPNKSLDIPVALMPESKPGGGGAMLEILSDMAGGIGEIDLSIKNSPLGPNSAIESRFLSGASLAADPTKTTAEATTKTVKKLDDLIGLTTESVSAILDLGSKLPEMIGVSE